jgi:hypothetical protein
MPALVNYLVDIYSMAMFETLDWQKEKNVTAFFVKILKTLFAISKIGKKFGVLL